MEMEMITTNCIQASYSIYTFSNKCVHEYRTCALTTEQICFVKYSKHSIAFTQSSFTFDLLSQKQR